MPFQTEVLSRIPNGIPGELAFDGPLRAAPGLLSSPVEANNVFGRAFTVEDHPDNVLNEGTRVQAGGTGQFYGIMSNPKEHVLRTGSQYLAQFNLATGEVASFVTMGQIYVDFDVASTPGQRVAFVNATGALVPLAAGAEPAAGQTLIPTAKVIRYLGSVTAPYNGLAVIQLTD